MSASDFSRRPANTKASNKSAWRRPKAHSIQDYSLSLRRRPVSSTSSETFPSPVMSQTLRLPRSRSSDHSSPPDDCLIKWPQPMQTIHRHSVTGTTGSSPLPFLSYCSSSPQSSTGGDSTSNQGPETKTVISRKRIKKRPRISDLQQHVSTSRIPNEQHPAQLGTKSLTPAPKRRCTSASAAVCFATPDRYISHRPLVKEKSSSYRTSQSPVTLRGQELYTRTRDSRGNPFRTVSETRSRQTIRNQRPNNVYRVRPAQHTPSWVHGLTADTLPVGRRPGAESLRQMTWDRFWTGERFWTVGGRVASYFGQLYPVLGSNGTSLTSGTNAPMHTPAFLAPSPDDAARAHQSRLALALDIDQTSRVLEHSTWSSKTHSSVSKSTAVKWEDGTWSRPHHPKAHMRKEMKIAATEKNIPSVAFRVLDAPHLKDDFYCSVLAYCFTSQTLAVALTHKVYLWTEEYGVRCPPLPTPQAANFVTSLAFSSDEGKKSILAIARHSGHVTLWSLLEPRSRFELPHPFPACCIAWRPTLAHRKSCRSAVIVPCEDLLVGNDNGRIYYYSVEWPDFEPGAINLLVKLDAHSQNLCGLAWAPDGKKFVSGGNDNIALLFEAETVLKTDEQINEMGSGPNTRDNGGSLVRQPLVSQMAPASGYGTPPATPQRGYIAGTHPNLDTLFLQQPATPPQPRRVSAPLTPPPSASAKRQLNRSGPILHNAAVNPAIPGRMNMHKLSFYHSAAVKAIAFAPWQPSLLATGGGSNDKQIHFHHTGSGSTLAVINVFAQVTSLTWSTTRREIVATFGYAQPEHEIRIAVFSWPSCECVVSIPWERKFNGEIGRALWAIPYPGGPNDAVPTRQQSHEGFAA